MPLVFRITFGRYDMHKYFAQRVPASVIESNFNPAVSSANEELC